jgi:hypothetical protein
MLRLVIMTKLICVWILFLFQLPTMDKIANLLKLFQHNLKQSLGGIVADA